MRPQCYSPAEVTRSRSAKAGRQPGDPDAAAYAEGAALPNPGAKLAGPSFEEWLAAAQAAKRRPSTTRV